jgi:hypothetical protein
LRVLALAFAEHDLRLREYDNRITDLLASRERNPAFDRGNSTGAQELAKSGRHRSYDEIALREELQGA